MYLSTLKNELLYLVSLLVTAALPRWTLVPALGAALVAGPVLTVASTAVAVALGALPLLPSFNGGTPSVQTLIYDKNLQSYPRLYVSISFFIPISTADSWGPC